MAEEKHYIELYKKYRPKRWEDLIGQDHVVSSLKKAVLEDKVPTGYLFAGGPGTGKALHKSTLLPTPFGYSIKMEDVKIGDSLVASDGSCCTVTHKYCPHDPVSCLVIFDDGTKVRTSGGHLWATVEHGVLSSVEIKDLLKEHEKIEIPTLSAPAMHIYTPDLRKRKLKNNLNVVLSDRLVALVREEAASVGIKTKTKDGLVEVCEDQARYIVEVDDINDKPEDYFCISVDSPDELFCCTDHYILTHNTSAAFILAKALNCDHVDEDGNPCNECKTCRAIENNTMPGINYISMANKGSVDDVRQIVQAAKLAQPVKKQVWICDEVQNLSTQAFDSLLVPLESDNMKALFVFCTTEPNKVRDAVYSRLQPRSFYPVSNKELGKLLYKIVENEGFKDVTMDDLKDITRHARGSVRNAIAGLEAFVTNGVIPESFEYRVLKCLTEGSAQDLFVLTEEMDKQAVSFVGAMEDLYRKFTEILVAPKSKIEKSLRAVLGDRGIILVLDIISGSLFSMSSKVVDHRILYEATLAKILFLRDKLIRHRNKA